MPENLFEPIDLSEWLPSDASLENSRIRDEITTRIDPSQLANRLAEEVKTAQSKQSKERTVASYIEQSHDKPDYNRRCFVIAIESESIFNQFFNGRCGYRAMYLRSPDLGKKYNKFALELLLNYLLRDANTRTSLTGGSAKIWPFFENHMIRNALIIPKWQNSPMGLSIFDPRYPVFSVKGAFFNKELQEFDPKRHRDQQLHDTGYT